MGVITTGTAETTQAQKSFSLESPEAMKLKEIISPVSSVSSKIITELEEIVRIQATTLDKIVFVNEYVNVPKVFEHVELKVVEMLKVYLWPYYTPSCSAIESVAFESGSYKTVVEVIFKQHTPSFDLKIVLPTEKVFFRNVRVIYPYNLFFPLTAARNNVHMGLSKVVSGSVLSSKSCMIQGKHLIKIIPTGSLPKVLVNGQPMEIPVGSGNTIVVKDLADHTILAELSMTPDHVVVVKAPRFLLEEVKTNGHIIEVIPSVQLKNKLCGV